MKRYIAIDFGLKRIGLSISDPLKITARPLKTLDFSDTIFDVIKKEIKDNDVEKAIVGYPEKSNNNDKLLEEIDKLIDELNNLENLTVIKWDESFSSQKAMQKMIQSGKKKKFRQQKSQLDAFAAAEILTDYLNNG